MSTRQPHISEEIFPEKMKFKVNIIHTVLPLEVPIIHFSLTLFPLEVAPIMFIFLV